MGINMEYCKTVKYKKTVKRRLPALGTALLSLALLTACGGKYGDGGNTADAAADNEVQISVPEDGANPHVWEEYDALIDRIEATADFGEREALMHRAEDMLMETGAVIPICYHGGSCLQKDSVTDIFFNPYGIPYFRMAGSEGDTLRIYVGDEPETLDPAMAGAPEEACLAVNSYAGLYTYDADGRLVMDLAASEEVSSDGLTYTFTLLPDLKWSDGSSLEAEDFVASWNRACREAADYAGVFDIIAENEDGTLKVEANAEEEDGSGSKDGSKDGNGSRDGNKTQSLTIELAAPCAYFRELLALPMFCPVKEEETGMLSNGAYILDEWVSGEGMTYIKNPNYHRADEVATETLQFIFEENTEAAYRAYCEGELDFVSDIADGVIEKKVNEAVRDDAGNGSMALTDSSELHAVNRAGLRYVGINVNSPVFNGKTPIQANAMRRAFALLIDREYICDYALRGGQKPANTFIPGGVADGRGGIFKANDEEYSYPDEGSEGYFDPDWTQADMDEAVGLLAYAGYQFENGVLSPQTPLSLTCLTEESEPYAAAAEALRQDFALLGIDMTVNAVDCTTFLKEKMSGEYDMVWEDCFPKLNDPVTMLQIWSTDSSDNICQFGGSF